MDTLMLMGIVGLTLAVGSMVITLLSKILPEFLAYIIFGIIFVFVFFRK